MEMTRHWSDQSVDPNSRDVVAARSARVRNALRPPVESREAMIRLHCSGKRVLDVGCVDHFAAASTRLGWLHREIDSLAARCVGVDLDSPHLRALAGDGYDVVGHDVNDGARGLPEELRRQFDVVVAGEILEHLDRPVGLFELARDALVPNGRLVITTPNPYCPRYVRNGQLALTYGNVDHVLFAFPSGIVEWADRVGLLTESICSLRPRRPRAGEVARSWAAALRDRARRERRPRDMPMFVSPVELLELWLRPDWMLGTTSIYVLVNPA